jgi:hypothetical protein
MDRKWMEMKLRSGKGFDPTPRSVMDSVGRGIYEGRHTPGNEKQP